MPEGKDGISFMPALLGSDGDQERRNFIVYASHLGPALVTADGWKLRYINRNDTFQLYDLKKDYREENDLAPDCPEITNKLSQWLSRACDGDYRNGSPQSHEVFYDKK